MRIELDHKTYDLGITWEDSRYKATCNECPDCQFAGITIDSLIDDFVWELISNR